MTDPPPLDHIDRGILYLLQENARDVSTEAIGERVGVAASTVRNRISKLEAAGVLEGFHPEINYEAAGFPLHLLFACFVPPERIPAVAPEVLDIDGVVEVTELMTGRRNMHVHVVHTTTSQIRETVEALDDLGVEVTDTGLISRTHRQPFDHFGETVAESDADGAD